MSHILTATEILLLLQEVVDSLEIKEIPESLLIDMGTLQYRTTLLDMIEKVSTIATALPRLLSGGGLCNTVLADVGT